MRVLRVGRAGVRRRRCWRSSRRRPRHEVVDALDRNLCRCGVQRRMVARRPEGGRAVTAQLGAADPGRPAPQAPDATTPKDVAANPRLSTWVRVDGDGTRARAGRQGRARPGHPDRADPARRRRARPAGRPGPRPRRHHRRRAGRGTDRRQHVGRRLRRRGPRGLRPPAPLFLEPPAARRRRRRPACRRRSRRRRWRPPTATCRRRRPRRDVDSPGPQARRGRRSPAPRVPRVDLPDKVRGRARFIQDLVLPGQLWGQVVRPPSPAARPAYRWTTAGVEALPGVVAVVRDGSFLGVVCDDERAGRPGGRGAAGRCRRGRSTRRCPTRPT